MFLPLTAQGQGGYTRSQAGSYTARDVPPQNLDSVYAAAYRLMREAQILAGKQSYHAALQKGREAERILAGLVRDYPDWNPNLVSYKRKQLAEAMATYSSKVGRNGQLTRQQPTTPISSEAPRPGSTLPSDYDPLNSDYRPVPLPNHATTDRALHEALARAQEECRRMAEAYRELNTRYKDTQKKLVEAQKEEKIFRERYEKLREQVALERQVGNNVVDSLTRRYEEMETKFHASEAALKEAQARADELDANLLQARNALERVTRERDSLLQENEKLRAIVELNSPEKTKALLDQNLTLAEKLKTAQEKISQLEAMQTGASDENAVLSRQLEEARAEAARLREQMSEIEDENMGYRKRISELTEQLNNLEADLAAKSETPVVDPALAEENNLLRGLIEKQRRTLAMQEESRRLLFETYQALKKDDPEVMKILRKMMEDDNPQELTATERKILEDVRKGITQSNSDAVRQNLAVQTLADLANKAFSKGRYVSAEQLYLNFYDLMPDHVPGLVNLGTILLYNNKNEEAVKYLSRAIRLSPSTAVGYYLAGVAYYRLEQMPEASKMFSRTVQLDPGNAEAFFYLANIEAISGMFDRSLKHFAAAVKIKPELADAHYNMARLYAETKRIPEAARSYDRAILNGSAPDPEFESFLRHHPDNAKAPGVDLVAAVKPEQEARTLRQEMPADDLPPLAEQGKGAAASQPAPTQPAQDAFEDAWQKLTTPVAAVQTPSPAGAGHETPESRFGVVRMQTSKGILPFRLKRAAPRRVRTRGSEEISPFKPAPAPAPTPRK